MVITSMSLTLIIVVIKKKKKNINKKDNYEHVIKSKSIKNPAKVIMMVMLAITKMMITKLISI